MSTHQAPSLLHNAAHRSQATLIDSTAPSARAFLGSRRQIDARVGRVANSYTLLLLAFTLTGFGLRLVLLDAYPLREDEAIYSYWALHLSRVDPWFLSVWPDKPPIYLWTLAGAFRLFGVGDPSARFANVAVSTLTIPVIAATARHLWGRRAGLVAGLFYALSPFAISFAPSVFTDPLLVCAGSLSLLLALRTRFFWSGLWLGVAIMTKQQGVLYIPIILSAIGFVIGRQQLIRNSEHGKRRGSRSYTEIEKDPDSVDNVGHAISMTPLVNYDCPADSRTYELDFNQLRHIFVSLSKWVMGLLAVLLPILYWDSRRWAVAPSPWDLGTRNYATLTFVPPQFWPDRAQAWAEVGWYLTASWPIWGGLGLAALWMVGTRFGVVRSLASKRNQTGPANWMTATLIVWSLAFAGLHLVFTIQTWDRYLLPLATMLALLAGWALASISNANQAGRFALWLPALALLLMPPALRAAHGELPIGGDHGAYSGLTEAISLLPDERSEELVLYHDVLGWHLRYYLFDEIESGSVDLRWFPSAPYLADNAAKTRQTRRYLIQPRWAAQHGYAQHLAVRGLRLETRHRTAQMTVYEIVAAGRERNGLSRQSMRPAAER